MTRQRKAEVYILATTFVYGSTFVIARGLLDHITPLIYTGIRFVLASLIVVIFYFRRVKTIPTSTWIKGSVLGILLFIGFAVQTIGLQYTTTSKSAFFTGMLVVFTPIVHFSLKNILKLERKPLMYGNILGVVLAALGLYLLTSPSGGTFNIGDALSLVCAFLFALYIVYLDFASSEPDKIQLIFVQFILCGILGFVSAWLFEDIRIEITQNALLSLAYLTIFATVISMWIQNQYQGDTTPTRVAVIFSLEPVIAGIFGYTVRGENIGMTGLIGGVIIMTGLLLSELSEEIPMLKINMVNRNPE